MNIEAIVQQIARQDTRCRYVRLSCSFGYQFNITTNHACVC